MTNPSPLEFDDTPQTDQVITRPVAWRWNLTQELVPTRMTTWDSHPELFRKNLAAEALQTRPIEVDHIEYQLAPPGGPEIPVYRHDGDYAKRYDGIAPGGGDRSADLSHVYPDADRTASLRLAQASARAIRATGVCNAPHLLPGCVARLTGHPSSNDQYIVTRAEHRAAIPEGYWASVSVEEYSYQNEFEAIPTGLLPRPPLRTPRPKVGGPLTAVVVGPPGYHIYVDKYGRIKVQFWWDRDGQFNAESSCWVRVSQLWAGAGWGAFFWPRVGMEVIVHFENGDPDRPLVTGCVYNAENVPPTFLPIEATIAGIKSHIPGGDPSQHFNAIYIHDTPGVEYIQLHSEKSEAQHSEGGRYHYTSGIKMDIRGRL
jgi:Rhs element Vgr protein